MTVKYGNQRLIKRGGQVFEEKDDSLLGRVNQLDTTTPTSPQGAASIGASPHAARMTGSGAQRQNALRQAVQPKEQTLRGAQRLEGPAQATSADQSAQQRAEQLRQIGAMGTRVQSQIEQRLAATPEVSGELGIQASREGLITALQYTPEQIAADEQGPNVLGNLQNLINQYMAAPSQDLLVQMTELGLSKDQVYGMTGLTETGAEATGRLVADAMADRLTISELSVEELGFANIEELNTAMGMDVSNMTIPEFQAALEELQGAEYDRLEEIRAEIAGLPTDSARREMLIQEAAALGDVGMTGAEQMVAQTVEDIDTAGTVTIGGEDYTIEEILSDEGISELIEEYIYASDEMKEDIFPAETFGGLRTWIDENMAGLSELIEGAEETRGEFKEANVRWEGMRDSLGLSEELMATMGYDPDQPQTTEGVNAWLTENGFIGEERTGLGSLYSIDENGDISLSEGISPTIATDITEDNKEAIAGMTAEQIVASNELYNDVEANSVLATLTGIDPDGSNFLSEDGMNSVADWQVIADTISGTSLEAVFHNNEDFQAAVKDGTLTQDWLNPTWINALKDPLALELIKSGQLTAANRKELLAEPAWTNNRYEYGRRASLNARINEAYANNNVDAMLDEVFGTNVDVADMERYITELQFAQDYAGIDNQSLIDKYKALLNPETLRNKALAGSSLMDFLQGKEATFNPDPSLAANTRNAGAGLFGADVSKNALTTELYDMYQDDGVISAEEIINSNDPGAVHDTLKSKGKLPKNYARDAGKALWKKFEGNQSKALRNVDFRKVSDPKAEEARLVAEARDWFDKTVEWAKAKYGDRVPHGIYANIRNEFRRKKERIRHEKFDALRYQTANKDYKSKMGEFEKSFGSIKLPKALKEAALGRIYAKREIRDKYRSANSRYNAKYGKLEDLTRDPKILEDMYAAWPRVWGDRRGKAERMQELKDRLYKFEMAFRNG